MKRARIALALIVLTFVVAEIVRPTRVPAKKLSAHALILHSQAANGTGIYGSLDRNLLNDLPRIHPDAAGYVRCSVQREGSFRLSGAFYGDEDGSAVFVLIDGVRLGSEATTFGQPTQPHAFTIVVSPQHLGYGKHRLNVALVSADERGFFLLPQTVALTIGPSSHEADDCPTRLRPARLRSRARPAREAVAMRTLIIGASGQLGNDLMRAFADDKPIGVDHAMVDIEAPSAIATLLAHHRPDLVINTAAFHNVELCELRPDRAFAVNALAVDQLAAQCAAAGAAFAQISTDYVFDGTAGRPYGEDDAPNPLSSYGISKYAGERLLQRHSERFYIFRTCGLYGIRGSSTKGYTFIDRILTQASESRPLRIVDDVTCSPSYTLDVATAICAIVSREQYGTYHVTNSGACTWFEFAREILAQAGLTTDLTPTTADAFPSLARRPAYSALSNERLTTLGLHTPQPWREAVGAYLLERAAKNESSSLY